MEEKAKLYLDKVVTEYLDYKTYFTNFAQKNKTTKEDIAKAVSPEMTTEQIVDVFFEKYQQVFIHQQDFLSQQQRLFFTVEAYKDIIEIPQEILEEVNKIKFNQFYAVKGETATIVNQEAINFSKEQIQKEVLKGFSHLLDKL